MWLFKRTILGLVLGLAACGFTPVYGPDGAGRTLQNQVVFAAPDERNAQLLMQQLEARLGRAQNESYSLEVALDLTQEGLAIDADGNTTRYNMLGVAAYTLTGAADGAVMASGTVRNFTGYSATGTTVATLASERDAEKRLMNILADMIAERLVGAVQ